MWPFRWTAPLLLGPLALAGCAPRLARIEPPPINAFADPPDGKAQVCVLRPRLAPSKLVFLVHDNGKLVGATRGSSYFCYFAEPGPHRVTSQRTGYVEETLLTLEAGKRYYLYQNVDPYPDATRSWLLWTSEADARTMVGECTYRVLSYVPGGEKPPGHRPTARADAALAAEAAKAASGTKVERPEPEAPPPPPRAETPAGGEEVIDAKTAPDPPPRKRRRR